MVMMACWRSKFQVLCMLVLSLLSTSHASLAQQSLNVEDFGAVSDGKTENSGAFMEAWEKACGWEGNTAITVPKGGKYYVRQVAFEGPCKGSIKFDMQGDLYAPTDKASHTLEYWIKFSRVDYLTITGSGKLYGGGPSAWPYKGCGQGQACMEVVPHSLRLEYLKHALVQYITSVDSKDKHISVYSCEDLTLSNIRTTAPADSPNTDGVHTALSNGVRIVDSKFDTGDDCIAIFSGSTNVDIRRSTCGPGHGISIGSMGQYKDEQPITNISISSCTIQNSDNGFRMKSWAADSFPTFASDINVQDVQMKNVKNPIIIDQHYCPRGGCDEKAQSKVQFKNVKLRRIQGTSSTQTAVDIQCSSEEPCVGFELVDIYLPLRDPRGGNMVDSISSCSNVKGFASGTMVPQACV